MTIRWLRIQTCLLTSLMLLLGGCHIGTWGNRFTGQTYNLQGFGESGSEYGTLASKQKLAGSLPLEPLQFADNITNGWTADGRHAVIIRFNLGTIVVIGDSPPENRYRYSSTNPAIELWLIRTRENGADQEPRIHSLLAASTDARDRLDNTYRLEGAVAMVPPTSSNGHFDYIALDVGTIEQVAPNDAWLRSWQDTYAGNDAIALRVKRWKAVQATGGPALICGTIHGDYIFRGW